MNLPNRLSILRVALIPLCLGLMVPRTELADILALIVFLAASFTDFLDGHIARSRNLVTDFGKFLDPVADKLLVLSVLIFLSSQGRMNAWVTVIVLARELSIDGLRLVASSQGRVIAAGKLGKIKTVTQIITIGVALMDNWPFGAFPMKDILAGLMAAVTLWSGVDYFVRNRRVFSAKEGPA